MGLTETRLTNQVAELCKHDFLIRSTSNKNGVASSIEEDILCLSLQCYCTLNVCKAFELKSKMPSTSLLHYVARWFDNGKTLKR